MIISKFASLFDPYGSGGGERLNQLAIIEQRDGEEKTEQDLAKRLVSWYMRDRPVILEYLKTQAKITFGDKVERWQWPIINGVHRMVRRSASTYRKPPERKYSLKGKELEPQSPEMLSVKHMLRRIKPTKKYRELDRYSFLLNVAHMEPVWRNGAVHWDIHLRPVVTVIPDPQDHLEIAEFYKWQIFHNPDKPGQEIKGYRVWTDKEHYFLRNDGQVFALAWTGQPSTNNPYLGAKLRYSDKPIPIITVRKLQADEYWGRYGADLVDAFEQAAIQLGDMWQNAFLQSHAVAVLINCLLGDQTKPGQKIDLSAEKPIIVDGVTSEDVLPQINFHKPDTDLEKLQSLIDWFIRNAGSAYGQPPSAWSQENQPESGFSKLVDELEIMEIRDEEIVDWKEIEQKGFEWTKIVHNTWCAPGERVNPEIELETTFKEVEFPMSAQEDAAYWSPAIADNRESVVDYIMKKRKIDNRDEALKVAKTIAQENNELRKMGLDPSAIANN